MKNDLLPHLLERTPAARQFYQPYLDSLILGTPLDWDDPRTGHFAGMMLYAVQETHMQYYMWWNLEEFLYNYIKLKTPEDQVWSALYYRDIFPHVLEELHTKLLRRKDIYFRDIVNVYGSDKSRLVLWGQIELNKRALDIVSSLSSFINY